MNPESMRRVMAQLIEKWISVEKLGKNKFKINLKVMLTPIDKERCQAEKPNGESFMTLGGGSKIVRCTNKPTVIITETKAGKDGLKGAMSLCNDCLRVAQDQLPKGYFEIEYI